MERGTQCQDRADPPLGFGTDHDPLPMVRNNLGGWMAGGHAEYDTQYTIPCLLSDGHLHLCLHISISRHKTEGDSKLAWKQWGREGSQHIPHPR